MSDVWDQFAPAPEVRRDRYGRYLVLPPEGGKPVGYTRATTVAKVLDDQSSLIDWGKRMTAIGLAQRPDLLALVATSDPDDRKTLNDLCAKASEAGGATARRDLGTALHSMLERSWFDPTYQAPEAYRSDIEAVHRALDAAGLAPMPGMAERMVVNDLLHIAGMFDLALTDGTTQIIGDVKTGSSVQWGSLAWAIQLHIYTAASAIYTQGPAVDGSLDERHPMPTLDQSRAIVIHVQPGSGQCDLHELDLTIGERGLELAVAVREIRKARPLSRIAVTAAPPVTPVTPQPQVEGDTVSWLRARVTSIIGADVPADTLTQYNVASAGELMAAWWPEGVPTLRDGGQTAAMLDAIAERCAMVEQALGLPFPAVAPDVEADNVRVLADDPRIVELIDRLRILPADLLTEVEQHAVAAGITAKVSLGLPLGKLRALDEIIDDAEVAHRARIARIDVVLDEWSPLERLALLAGTDPVSMTANSVELLELLSTALATGYLVVPADTLAVSAACGELLALVHPNKRDALNHTKRAAKAHGVTAPTSFAEILGDPLLVALCISDPDTAATTAAA